MDKLPARTGWDWIKQGFGLFRKQPIGLATLFLGYLLVTLAIGIIPVLGQVLPVILAPVFSVAFMQACAYIDRDVRVLPNLLMSGFRKPVFLTLFQLGLLYLLVAAIAIGATALVDGGVFWELITGELDPRSEAARQAPLGLALTLAVAIYIPAAMAFCFSAPLIFWQNMSLVKAIFFSFFAVLRAFKSFLVFTLSWFGLMIFLSNLLLALFGKTQAPVLLALPLSVILAIIMHCSFYASYRQIFGAPGAPEAGTPASDAA